MNERSHLYIATVDRSAIILLNNLFDIECIVLLNINTVNRRLQ